jgi:voltage-gated potassium channel
MELLAGSECEVEEFQLSTDPKRLGELQGASLEDLHLRRRSGALVLAVRNPKGEVMDGHSAPSLIANPGGHVRLEPGQLLVVMGSQEQLSRLRDLLGEALVDVGAMPA